MPIKYTSGKAILSQVTNKLKVKTTDWIPYIGTYIYDVLDELKCPLIASHYKQSMSVIDQVAAYPDNYESLDYITFQDGYVRSTNFGFTVIPNDIRIGLNVNVWCKLLPNGIKFDNLKNGLVTIYYTKIRTEVDPSSGAIIPFIPDDNNFIDACSFKILMELLINGYVHPTYNLTQNNKYTNVGMLYDQAIKKAKNTVEPITRDMAQAIHKIHTNPFKTFTDNYISRFMVFDLFDDITDILDTPTYKQVRFLIASTVWIIPHSFKKEPNVQEYDSNGKWMLGNITQLYTNVNGTNIEVINPTSSDIPTAVKITFDVPTTGVAILTV